MMMSLPNGQLIRDGSAQGLWRGAQGIALVAFLAIIIGLFVFPDITLVIMWNVVIPLVPASLLVSPILWRGVCPVATLNMIPNGWLGRRAINVSWSKLTTVTGIALLGLLIPARHFLFNSNATALAIGMLGASVLAFILGTVFDAKAGFCNSICPLLSVERLYGQHPLLTMGNPRCASCTVCTPRGCIDLAPVKSVSQTIGPARRSHAWLTSPFGFFAAAFPGFVIGYFTTRDIALSAAPRVYLDMALWSLGSYVVVNIVVRALGVPSTVAFPTLGALAAGCYYWLASPTIVTALGLPVQLTTVIRLIAVTLIGVWLWTGLRSATRLAR